MFTPTVEDVREELREPTNRLLLERLRASLWVILFGVAVFTTRDLLHEGSWNLGAVAVRLAYGVFVLVFLRALRRDAAVGWAPWLAQLAAAAQCLEAGGVSILRHDITVAPLVLIGGSMFAATLFPWGVWRQLAGVTVAELVLLWNAHGVTGGFAPAVGLAGTAAIVTFCASLYVASALERSRVALERSHLALRGYAEVVESASDLIQSVSVDNRFTFVNRAWREALGYSEVEAAQLLLPDILHPDCRASCLAAFDAALAGEPVRALAAVFRTKAGAALAVEGTVARYFRHGRPAGTRAHFRDVTERRRMDETLRRSERYFRSLIENADDVVTVTDAAAVVRYVSPPVTRIFGYQPEDVIGRSSYEFVHPDDLAKCAQSFAEALQRQGAGPGVLEFRMRHRDGSWRVVEGRINSIPHDPAVGGFVINTRDITERWQAEAARRQLAQAVESAAESIILTDRVGRITQVNPAFTQITGYAPAEALGETPRLLKSGEHDPAFYAELWRTITAGRTWAGRVRDRRKDGSLYHAALTIAPIRDGAGQISGYVGVQRDVSEDIAREQALAAALHDAQAATRAKSEFVANMSHEVRTPLNGIIGMTELALATKLDPEQRDYLRMARESAEALLRLVNDILDFSRIEAGRLALDAAPFDPADTVRRATGGLAARARQKGLELGCRIAAGVPAQAVGDAGRFGQVLVNLVDNAIKFTERGRVAIAVRRQADTAADVVLHVTVTDTGIGVAPEQRERIFGVFEQADGSTTRRFGGTGLGLAIAVRLVRLMGGRIWIDSEVGRGSTFHFTVRFGAAQQRAAAPPADGPPASLDAAVPLRPLRVLVVEDNPVNQQVVVRLLEKRGHGVVVAGNGREALDVLERQGFDVVLMDVQMPEMDGFEAVGEIRRRERARGLPHLPVVAMTAYAMQGDEQRCLAAGMDAYVSKPVRSERLFAVVADVVGNTPAQSAVA